MTDPSAAVVANHLLENILKDLTFLKDNHFLAQQTYNDVVAILPSHITAHEVNGPNKPPLPMRKSVNSTSSTTSNVASVPRLPIRRTPEPPQQQPQSQQQLFPQPTVLSRVLTPTPPTVEESRHTPPPAYSQKASMEPLATAEALYDYSGDPATDLSFKQGDTIEVTEYVNDDWWKGTAHGKSGIFPQNHVKKIPPPVKAKRPWIPAKPSLSSTTITTTAAPAPATTSSTLPYSYPPPPTTIYSPPPAQPPANAYIQPSTVIVQQQQPTEQEGGDKVANMAKKFGGHVATAATWGFGATLGSQAASAIF